MYIYPNRMDLGLLSQGHDQTTPRRAALLLIPRPLAAARLMAMQLKRNPVNLTDSIQLEQTSKESDHAHIPEKGHTRDGSFLMWGTRGRENGTQNSWCYWNSTCTIRKGLLDVIGMYGPRCGRRGCGCCRGHGYGGHKSQFGWLLITSRARRSTLVTFNLNPPSLLIKSSGPFRRISVCLDQHAKDFD